MDKRRKPAIREPRPEITLEEMRAILENITEYLNYGEENLICVRADATLEEGWFYEGAGIYRHEIIRLLRKDSMVNIGNS